MFHKVVGHQNNLMKNYNSFPTPFEVTPASTELAINLSSHSHLLNQKETSPNIKQIATSMTVAKIARPVTVQIHTSYGVSGSGVIIKTQENIYTVLTANHLVKHRDAKYMIHTHRGKNYSAIPVRQLQSDGSMPHLSIIQFSTSDVYPVATLSHTDEKLINTDVYISGYFQILDSQQQEFKLINGTVVNYSLQKSWYCSTVKNGDMNGSPVFNSQGQVIGIYITREVDKDSGINSKNPRNINIFMPLPNLTQLLFPELRLKLVQKIKCQEVALH